MSAALVRQAVPVITLAAIVNAGLLMMPALAMQAGHFEPLLADPRCLVLLTAGTLLLLADAASLSVGAEDLPATQSIDRRQHLLALLTGLLLWGTLAGGLATVSSGYSYFALLAGGLLMLLGAGLRFLAIYTLRRQFTSGAQVDSASRQLVQSGIFCFVRHPSELGLITFAMGATALLGSPIAAAGTALLLITSLVRMHWEDEQLALAWPDEFAAYRQRVAALVPLPKVFITLRRDVV